MLEVIAGSAVGSPFVKVKSQPLVENNYASTFSSKLMLKDLKLALGQRRAGGGAIADDGGDQPASAGLHLLWDGRY